ncbi:MAG: alpha/beta hydrolase [Bacillota bacterium]
MGALAALTRFDRFVLGNFLLWSGVILFGYRWRNLEFYIYVLLVLLQAAGMFAAWAALRRFRIPLWALLLLQVAIVLHLLGGTIFIEQTRLYDLHLIEGLPLPAWFSQFFRYDKLVHLYFAAIGVAGLSQVWPQMGLGEPRGIQRVVIFLTVMGICAIVEALEYMGTKLAHIPEVGGYDNNLQDLLSNLVGALLALVPWRRLPWRIPLRATLLLVILLLAAPLPGAMLLTFPPGRPIIFTPASVGLAYEEVKFPSRADGAWLRGWYIPAEGGGEQSVVLVHGWVNNRLVHDRGLPLARALVAAGYNVLLFDLRGHGESERLQVTLGNREQGDVAGALAFVRERGARQVAVVGYSIGAVSALQVVGENPEVKALVADSAYSDLQALVEGLLKERANLPPAYARYALRVLGLVSGSDPARVAPLRAAARLEGLPVLFIHGTADRVIPVEESRKLWAAVDGAELWIVEGGRHTHSFEVDPEAYIARILQFLGHHMPAKEALPGSTGGGPLAMLGLRSREVGVSPGRTASTRRRHRERFP